MLVKAMQCGRYVSSAVSGLYECVMCFVTLPYYVSVYWVQPVISYASSELALTK